jgi:uncharacterized delta-60 repeat protein
MNLLRLASCFATLILAWGWPPASAAPTPDAGFADAGMMIGGLSAPVGSPTIFGDANEGLVADARGGVIFVNTHRYGGYSASAHVRLLPTGRVDGAFDRIESSISGPFLPAIGSNPVTASARDRLNRIVSVQTHDRFAFLHAWRHFDNGMRDSSFGRAASGSSPVVVGEAYGAVDIQAQDDSKILLVTGTRRTGEPDGSKKITVIRLAADGSLDPTFGVGGIVTTGIPGGTGFDVATGIAVRPDRKILVVGWSLRVDSRFDTVVVRYLENGAPDPGFGVGGIAIVGVPLRWLIGRKLSIQPDGTIVVVGTLTDPLSTIGHAVMFRLREGGLLDPTFGVAGMTVVPLWPHGGGLSQVVRQPDGRLVAIGNYQSLPRAEGLRAFALRFTPRGALDTSWGVGGRYDIVPPPGYTDSLAHSVANYDPIRIVVSGTLINAADERTWFVTRLWAP